MEEGGNLRGIEESGLKRFKRTAGVTESLSNHGEGVSAWCWGSQGWLGGWDRAGCHSRAGQGRNLFGCNTPKYRDSPPAATIPFPIGIPWLYISPLPTASALLSPSPALPLHREGGPAAFRAEAPHVSSIALKAERACESDQRCSLKSRQNFSLQIPSCIFLLTLHS